VSVLRAVGSIDASPLSQRVLSRIRDRILAGALKPGAWLRLTDLAAELGTSVTPVRTALQTLEHQGLVKVAKARGFCVVSPTRRDDEDAYLITAFISGELAARAAHPIRSELTARIASVHERMTAVAAGHAGGDVDALNWEFHREIHLAAESPRALSTLRSVTRSVPHDFHRLVPGWTLEALGHHALIIDALREGDAAQARRLAEQHVRLGCERLIAHFERIGYWSATTS